MSAEHSPEFELPCPINILPVKTSAKIWFHKGLVLGDNSVDGRIIYHWHDGRVEDKLKEGDVLNSRTDLTFVGVEEGIGGWTIDDEKSDKDRG